MCPVHRRDQTRVCAAATGTDLCKHQLLYSSSSDSFYLSSGAKVCVRVCRWKCIKSCKVLEMFAVINDHVLWMPCGMNITLITFEVRLYNSDHVSKSVVF